MKLLCVRYRPDELPKRHRVVVHVEEPELPTEETVKTPRQAKREVGG